MLSSGKTQGTVFQIPLEQLLNKSNALYILSNKIDWSEFETSFRDLYCHDNGRPAKPIRLMVALHYLKYTFNLSDVALVQQWVENPYWQYFCGELYFQFALPLDPTSLTRWRKRVELKNLDKLLSKTIETGLKIGAIRNADLQNVNADTTVAEKNVAYPTDTKLLYKIILKLGNYAKEFDIKLRQSFIKVGKRCVIMQYRYRFSRRYKKANMEIKKLKTYLAKLMRDIKRKSSIEINEQFEFNRLIEFANRLLNQNRNSKNKLYSLHEPDVECIAKGKAHKKYEFGCKVGIVTTSRNCYILSSLAFHGAPYDGHTLNQNISHAKNIIAGLGNIKQTCVDQGYRKHNLTDNEIAVNIVKRGWRKEKNRTLRKWLKRRSSIEPVIGHLKTDNRLGNNYLKGKQGDRVNALLCACGYNMRKLIAHIFYACFKSCIILNIIDNIEKKETQIKKIVFLFT